MLTDMAEIAAGVYNIDDHVCDIGELGSVYLVAGEKLAIIDSGPSKAAPAVLGGISRAGYDPADVDYIVVTHVHLDHAGGAGHLLQSMPKAKVVVHPRGARHMINMSRLIASAVAVQGKSVIDRYGNSRSVPQEKVIEAGDGFVVDLGGGQSLEIIDAPGHAPHEICIRETHGNTVFLGDALGLLLNNGQALLPLHPPPSFDPESCIATAERLAAMQPSVLGFAHFGPTEKAAETLDWCIEQMQGLTDFTAAAYGDMPDEELERQLTARFLREMEPMRDNETLYNYIRDNLVQSGVNGFMNYFKKIHENKT